MEKLAMADSLTNQAVHLAVRDLERDLVEAGRQYEDAERDGDAHSMAYALQQYNLKQSELERLTGANQPPQQGLLDSEKDFISRRIAQGDELTPAGWRDFEIGAARALQ